MDQVKIGKFIAECRKKNGLTQMQLAEKLCITDRAVSKWETGKTMPDSSIMLELCDALDITVNDLLNGECVSSENYIKKLETQLLEVVRKKELADKRALRLARFINEIAFWISTIGVILSYTVPTDNIWLVVAMWLLVLVPVPCLVVSTKVSYGVGYYQCELCGRTHRPTFWKWYFAKGVYGKKKLECTVCGKKTWHYRVYNKK